MNFKRNFVRHQNMLALSTELVEVPKGKILEFWLRDVNEL